MKRAYLSTLTALTAIAACLTLSNCDNKSENSRKPKAQARKLPHARALIKPSIRQQDDVDAKGNTALIRSISSRKNAEAQELIKQGADINHQNNMGDTPLMVATTSGNVEMVKLLLKNNVNINLRTLAGSPALSMAINMRKRDITALLINAGADCNFKDARGYNPLYFAVDMEDLPTVRLLLDNGADVNAHCGGGVTALNLAESKNNQALISLLKASGAQPYELKDCDLLLKAARAGNLTQLRAELNKGVHPDSMDASQDIAIVLAAKYGHFSIVKELISRGCNIDQFSKRSMQTALYAATLNKHVDIVKLLVSKGANFRLKGYGNKTVLDIALMVNNREIIKCLQDAGAE